MKKRRFGNRFLIGTIGFVILLFLVDAGSEYYEWRTFPYGYKHRQEQILRESGIGGCSAEFLGNSISRKSKVDACFAKAVLEEEILSSEANPFNDSAIFIYICEAPDFAARAYFLYQKSDFKGWCGYTVADKLEDLPMFNTQDVTIVPGEPSFLLKMLVALFG